MVRTAGRLRRKVPKDIPRDTLLLPNHTPNNATKPLKPVFEASRKLSDDRFVGVVLNLAIGKRIVRNPKLIRAMS